MWKHSAGIGLVLGLVLSSAPGPKAADVGKMPLSPEPLKILDGRLLIHMPQGAKIEPRKNPSIMGADPSTEEEARVVLEAGDEKVVLMAYETFLTAGADFEKVVRQFVGKWQDKDKPDVEALPSAGKGKLGTAKIVMVTPKGVADKDAKAILVREAFVLLPDHTVLVLNLYVNPKAYEDRAGCLALARAILESAVPGGKKLPVDAGARRLAVSGENHLEIAVPAGFVLTRERGIDFVVYRIREVVPLNDFSPTIVLYYGGHPAFHPGAGEGESKPVESTGKVLGKTVTWYSGTKKRDDAAVAWTETLVRNPLPDDEHMFIHLTLAAGDARKLDSLRKMVETLGVVKAEKTPPAASKPAGEIQK